MERETEGIGTPISRLEFGLGAGRGRLTINLGAQLRGVRSDESDVARLREQFTHIPREKDSTDIALLRRAAVTTTAGFSVARKKISAGVTERALQNEIETEFLFLLLCRKGLILSLMY